jgi:outer membrane protein assembly factor BamD
MLKKTLYIIFSVSILLILTSCSRDFDKLLKSDDYGLKLSKAYEYFEAEDYYRAQTLFEQARPFYRGTKELEKIYFHYAYTQYYQEKYILSAYYFKDFYKNYPNSEYAEESQYMAAYSNYEMSPNHKLEQSTTVQAIDGFQLFVNSYPNSDRVERCNILIDELRAKLEKKAIATADLYYKLREYQAATQSYQNVLQDYPDTRAAAQIRIQILKASYELALNSVDSKKEERLEDAIEAYRIFKDRHGSNEALMEEATKIYNTTTERLAKFRSLQ